MIRHLTKVKVINYFKIERYRSLDDLDMGKHIQIYNCAHLYIKPQMIGIKKIFPLVFIISRKNNW